MTQEVILETRGLSKSFGVRQSFIRTLVGTSRSQIIAVDNVNLKIARSEILGLVGESGCGKTTTGRLIAMLETPSHGQVYYRDQDTGRLRSKKARKVYRRNVQMIFQDPYESLDPRLPVIDIASEPLRIHHGHLSAEEKLDLVRKALDEVELVPPDDFLDRFPHELSGGQRQRVAVARAVILEPELIVADEPVSMLDVSIRTGVLNTLLRLRRELGISFLFITHDLAVARYVSDRIAVMYLGRIVETGKTEDVIGEANHPYTQLLLSAAPEVKPLPLEERFPAFPPQIDIAAQPPSGGCRFYPRCPHAFPRCAEVEPQLAKVRDGHHAACLLIEKGPREEKN